MGVGGWPKKRSPPQLTSPAAPLYIYYRSKDQKAFLPVEWIGGDGGVKLKTDGGRVS